MNFETYNKSIEIKYITYIACTHFTNLYVTLKQIEIIICFIKVRYLLIEVHYIYSFLYHYNWMPNIEHIIIYHMWNSQYVMNISYEKKEKEEIKKILNIYKEHYQHLSVCTLWSTCF